MNIKQGCAFAVSLLCVAEFVLTYGSPSSYIWLLAIAGWIPHIFREA